MVDLYVKYMAYRACQHYVTTKSVQGSSFRAGARVLAINSNQTSSVAHIRVLQDAYVYVDIGWNGANPKSFRAFFSCLPVIWLWHAYLDGGSKKKSAGLKVFQKSSPPHLGDHVVCLMHAPPWLESRESIEFSTVVRPGLAAIWYKCHVAYGTLGKHMRPPTFSWPSGTNF